MFTAALTTAIYNVKANKVGNVHVTVRYIHATTVAAVKQEPLHIPKVFVALGTQCEMRMCHTVICGFSGSTIFSTLSHKRKDFWEKSYSLYKVF